MPDLSAFIKAYDVRGLVPEQLSPEVAYAVGAAFAEDVAKADGSHAIVIGHDMRPSSPELSQAFARGVTERGLDVILIGLASTDQLYFASGDLDLPGAMFTASHNPAQYNGIKLCRSGARPVGQDSGLLEIRDLAQAMLGGYASLPQVQTPGQVGERDVLGAYGAFLRSLVDLRGIRPLTVVIDAGNGMAGHTVPAVLGTAAGLAQLPLHIVPLYFELDGTFPNHEANPLKVETLAALQAKVRAGGHAFGVAFDGDADRVGFVDERGEIIPMDFITALIAQDILATRKGVVFYDLRSSRVVGEVIRAAGGTPMMSRVGHAFIKQQMRDNNAIFAGELSGHYYFRDNYTAESSAMAVLSVANILDASGKPLSELIAPLRKYSQSGEINSRVSRDPKDILAEIKSAYAKGALTELDGVSIAFDDWWFNVRCSNTEPLVRLNLEARTPELMAARRDELLALIRA